MINEIWNNHQVADYSGKNINKWNFIRSWNHSRTAKHISLEDVLDKGVLFGSCFGNRKNIRKIPNESKIGMEMLRHMYYNVTD